MVVARDNRLTTLCEHIWADIHWFYLAPSVFFRSSATGAMLLRQIK